MICWLFREDSCTGNRWPSWCARTRFPNKIAYARLCSLRALFTAIFIQITFWQAFSQINGN